jgi:hypothetical protein
VEKREVSSLLAAIKSTNFFSFLSYIYYRYKADTTKSVEREVLYLGAEAQAT